MLCLSGTVSEGENAVGMAAVGVGEVWSEELVVWPAFQWLV